MIELKLAGQPLDLSGRLIAFEYEDNTGTDVDNIKIRFLDLPQLKIGTELTASLQTDSSSKLDLGAFTIINKTHDLKTDIFTVSGNILTDWTKKYSRSFSETELRTIVEKIAKELNLKAHILIDQPIDYLAQSDISNYAFLDQLARDYNAFFNIKGGELVFKEKTAFSNEDKLFLSLNQFSSFKLKASAKEQFKSVVIEVTDTKQNLIRTVKWGQGEPQKTIKTGLLSEQQALNLAKAKLASLNEMVLQGDFSMPGRPLFAGTHFKLQDSNYDHNFRINQLSHKITTDWQLSGQFTSV